MNPRWMKTLFAGGILLMAGHVHAPVHAGQKALLIGIGEYPYLPAESQLAGPRNDVRAMREFLVSEWGFSAGDIRMLVDREATKSEIRDALEIWLPGTTRTGDRVVIYFSGHGSQVRDDDGDERDGMDETFVPTDYGRNGERDSDMLRDDEVADALAQISDRQVIFIADSCHSGTVTRSLDTDMFSTAGNAKPRYLPPTGFVRSIGIVRDEEPISGDLDIQLTLSAALPYQLAWEADGSGIFTQHLIAALTDLRADLNANGRLTSSELIEYVRPRTEAWCERVRKCRELQFTPNMDPKNGSIVLQPVSDAGALTMVDESDPDAVSDILPGVTDGRVNVEISPGHRIPIGEELTFRLTSSVNGYLTLLDLTAEGDVVLLFPTAEDILNGKSGRIRANAPLSVPDQTYQMKFYAGDPVGPGRLMAIVTEDYVDLGSLLDGYRDFEPIEERLEFVSSITERLYRVWTGDDDRNRSARWTVGYTDYEIYR